MIIKILLWSSLLCSPNLLGASAPNLQERIATLEYNNAGLLQSVKEAEEAFNKIMNIVKSQQSAEQKLEEIKILAEQVASGESAPPTPVPAAQPTPPVRLVGGIPMQLPPAPSARPITPKPPVVPAPAVTPPMSQPAATSLEQLRQQRATRQAAIALVPPPPAPPIFVPSGKRPQPSLPKEVPVTPPPVMPTITPTPPPVVLAPTPAPITTLQPQANFADTVAWLKKFDGTIEKIMQSKGEAEIIRRDVLKEFNDNMPTFKQILINLPSKTQAEQDELVKNISEGIFDILHGADIKDEQLKAGVKNIYEQLTKELQGQVAALAIQNKMNELYEEALLKPQPAAPTSGESKRAAAEREAREAAEAEEKRRSGLPIVSLVPVAPKQNQTQFDMYKRGMERDLNNAFQASGMQSGDLNAIFQVDDALKKFQQALNDPLVTADQQQQLRQLGIQRSQDVLGNIRKDQRKNYELMIQSFTAAKPTAVAHASTPTPGYGTYAPTGGAATNVVAQPAMSTMTETQKFYFNDIKNYTNDQANVFYRNKVNTWATNAEKAILDHWIGTATTNLKDAFDIYQLALTDNRLTPEQKTEVKNSLIRALNKAKRLLEESIDQIRTLQLTDKKKIKDLIEALLQKAETESSTGMPAQLGSTGSTPSVSLPLQKTAPTKTTSYQSVSSKSFDCRRGLAAGDDYKDLQTVKRKLEAVINDINAMKKNVSAQHFINRQALLGVIPTAIFLYDNLWRLLPNPSVERDTYINILQVPLVELQSVQDSIKYGNENLLLDEDYKKCLAALIETLQEHRSDAGR